MQRPIGVTLLASWPGWPGCSRSGAPLVFLGIAKFTFFGDDVSFTDPQWGPAIWAIILAAIWFWVAAGLLERPRLGVVVRQLHRHLHADLRLLRVLGTSTLEAEFAPMAAGVRRSSST